MTDLRVLTPGHGALPEVAYADNPKGGGQRRYGNTDAPAIAIKRGEAGFHPIYTRSSADELNENDGVTPAQREAMLIGSLMGWAVPGADPDYWEDKLAVAGGMKP